MQGPNLCAKPFYCCNLDVAMSRKVFLDLLKLHVLQLANLDSQNQGCFVYSKKLHL